VYCASGPRHKELLDLARGVGAAIANRGWSLVSGGGNVSAMGALATGARDRGGHTIGVIPKALVHRELADVEADELVVTESMRERKQVMEERADAFIALPGGIGTLEEIVEVLSWRRLDLHQKPIILCSEDDFWAPLFLLIDHTVMAKLTTQSFARSIVDARSMEDCFAVLEAARAAADASEDFLLVEAEALGGRARFQPAMQPALARLLAATPRERLLKHTLCAGLYDEGRRALLISPAGPILMTFDRLVVATGAYDRLPGFPGNDLPGIVGVRAFERLKHADALPAGARVGLFGHLGEIEAALATGHRFAWVATPASHGGPGMAGAILGATLIAANGRRRIRSVLLEPGGSRPCDLLVLRQGEGDLLGGRRRPAGAQG